MLQLQREVRLMLEKNRGLWEIKMSAAVPNALELYIYTDVRGDYYDWWERKFVESTTSAEYFRKELEKYPDVREINIFINSLGGSVMEGTAIYNQLRRHPAHKTVYVDGFACSIASVIAMAGDTIIMPKNTMMMIHNAWTYAEGNAAELRKIADDLDTMNEAAMQAYLVKAGDKLSEERLKEMLDAETYLTAAQCIEYGLADEFAEDEADMESARQMLAQKSAERMAAEQMQQRQEKAIAALNKYFG